MLVSLLLGQDGQFIAGGLACDQVPMGNRYWREVLGLSNTNGGKAIVLDQNCETAVVELSDRELVDQILSYHLDPNSQQQMSIMARLEQPLQAKRRVVHSKFAA